MPGGLMPGVMARVAPLWVFVSISGVVCSASPASVEDLRRAVTRKPRAEYRGHSQEHMSRSLNGHLARSEGRLARACGNWTAPELQGFMALVLPRRSPELDHVYQKGGDRRSLQRSAEEYREHWRRANRVVGRSPHLHKALRDSHCRQAVMWWTHHLSEGAREHLRKELAAVPLLPEEEKAACVPMEGDEQEGALCLGVEQENSCDWCHSLQADRPRPGKHAPNALDPQFVGPDDGNPHGWDRKRRCVSTQASITFLCWRETLTTCNSRTVCLRTCFPTL